MAKCPDQHDVLVTLEMKGVEIDQCFTCRGIWLDAGELAMIAELAGVGEGIITEILEGADLGENTNRKCPRCNRKMHLIEIGGDRKIQLDRCRSKHGIWFDDKELKSLVESFDEGEEGAVARFLEDMFGNILRAKMEEGE